MWLIHCPAINWCIFRDLVGVRPVTGGALSMPGMVPYGSRHVLKSPRPLTGCLQSYGLMKMPREFGAASPTHRRPDRPVISEAAAGLRTKMAQKSNFCRIQVRKNWVNIRIYRSYSAHEKVGPALSPAHTDKFLSQTAARKNRIEHPIFHRTVSAQTIWYFITDKKSDIPYEFLLGCYLAHTSGLLVDLVWCDSGRRCRIINNYSIIISIVGFRHVLLSDWRTRSDFLSQTTIVGWKGQIFYRTRVHFHSRLF